MYDTAITFRTNKETKMAVQGILAELGLDISTALNIFMKKVERDGGIPFEVTLREEPNEETMEAIREIYEHPELTEGPYTTKKEILQALHA